MDKDIFLLGDSNLLREICGFNSIRMGSCTRWNSKKKEHGRFAAKFSAYGLPIPSRGAGKREKSTGKRNCKADCNKMCAEHTPS